MPTVTSIKPQRNRKRVNIYLDGKFSSKGRSVSGWGFGIDLDNFAKLGLKVGQVLTEEEIERIIKKAEFQKTLDKLLRYATLRPRSKKEINYWYRKRKVHLSLHKGLFNRLKRLELIDDEKFAKWWVGQRLQFKFKSKRELISELRIKGIDKDTIENVLAEAGIDETQMAKRLIEKKKYRWEKLDKLKAKKKTIEFLARKGFGWDVIRSVLS